MREPPASAGALLLIRDLVTHVGFQQLAVFRCAASLHRRGLTPLAMVLCRVIRVVYSAEMHWATDVAPGILLVHGNGIVISRDARIGPGCVLFHNVTLGISRSSDGHDGAPQLEDGVHVGPGAVVMGPVTIGSRSKIGPNAVVVASVQPGVSVRAPQPVVSPRPASNEPVQT